MKRFLAPFVAALLLAAPLAAQAQSYFFPVASSANQNLNNTYENCGFTSVGAGTSVSAAGSNSKTASPVSLCTTSSDWTDFALYISTGTSTTRYLIDICSTSNCSTVIAPNIYAEPNTGAPTQLVRVPLNVASGSTLYVRQQDNSGTNAITVALVGTVRNSQSAAGFNTMTALNADTTSTNACTSPFAVVNSGSTTYTTITSSTAATYGAFVAIPGRGSANATVAQAVTMKIATGAAASEVVLNTAGAFMSANASPFNRQPGLVTYASVASGTRLSAQVLGNSGTDSVCVGLYAFN